MDIPKVIWPETDLSWWFKDPEGQVTVKKIEYEYEVSSKEDEKIVSVNRDWQVSKQDIEEKEKALKERKKMINAFRFDEWEVNFTQQTDKGKVEYFFNALMSIEDFEKKYNLKVEDK